MGWTSTGDPYANVGDAALSFDSAEAAMAFAEKYGWEYTVCASVACISVVYMCTTLSLLSVSWSRIFFPYHVICLVNVETSNDYLWTLDSSMFTHYVHELFALCT